MESLKTQFQVQFSMAETKLQGAQDQATAATAAAAAATAAAAAKPSVIYHPGGYPYGSNWFCHSCGNWKGNRYCPSHGSGNGYWN